MRADRHIHARHGTDRLEPARNTVFEGGPDFSLFPFF